VPERVRGGGVQSLDRAFALLEHLADGVGPDGVALSDLAARSGLPLPTIHRLVRTLVASGHVRQLPSRRYALGPRLIRLGEAASRMLGEWARPQLTALVAATGESANLAMLDGDAVVYVAQVPSQHTMRMFTEVGRRVPAHCTGVGKALLATLPTSEVRALIARTGLPAATPHTITDPAMLLRELDRIRARGYAVDDAEQELGVRCVAVAVPGAPSATALSVSGPAARVTWEAVEGFVPQLRTASVSLAGQLAAVVPG